MSHSRGSSDEISATDAGPTVQLQWSAFTGTPTPGGGCLDRNMTGSKPFSQRETRALAGLFKVAQPGIFLSMHGAGTQAGPISDPTFALGIVRPGSVVNWSVAAPRNTYTWTGSRFTNGSSARGLDALVVLDPSDPNSLNQLAEVASAGQRVHSPYDPSVVQGAPPAGFGGGAAQARSWAWTEEGASGFLYEHLAQDPRDGTVFVWDSNTDEATVAAAATDFLAPMGRLVDLADNPLQDAAGSLDLAVEHVGSLDGACDRLETFWPEVGTDNPQDDFRYGQYGKHDVACDIRNWGTISLPSKSVRVAVDIIDHTNGALTDQASRLLGSLAAGARVQVSPTATYTFLEGHDYTVRCTIEANTQETELQTITVANDPGCLASGGVDPQCEPNGSGYDAVFPTNNQRELRFLAKRSADLVCRGGRRMPVNHTGAPVASIAAIVAR